MAFMTSKFWITTEVLELLMSIAAPQNGLRPIHPGEVLREDYLKPLGLSANALAQSLKVPASRINDIVLERRGVSVDTAMRLVRFFGGDVQSWMNLQTAFEVKVAQKTLANKINKEVLPLPLPLPALAS
jgi:addiction module HigA family antidote